MRKKILVAALVVGVCFGIYGCANEQEMTQKEYQALQEQVKELKEEKEKLAEETIEIKEEKGIAKYVLTFNISQTHFSLDISEHLKDSMNDIDLQIPVDKEYYDSVEIGDVITNDFRMGSLIFKGSFGDWKVKVSDKEIQ